MIIEKATEKDIDALEKMYYEVTAQLEKTVNYIKNIQLFVWKLNVFRML